MSNDKMRDAVVAFTQAWEEAERWPDTTGQMGLLEAAYELGISALASEQQAGPVAQQFITPILPTGSREAAMVVIKRDASGTPTVWCDPEIVDLVRALNDAGIATVASCSGHGHRPGRVSLADGRELVIARGYDEARRIDGLFSTDINGEKRTTAPAAPVVPEEWRQAVAEQFVALSDTRPADNAEEYLRQKYGAYRGHQEWRALEEAFLAGSASRSAAVELTDAEIEERWWGELDNRSLSSIRAVLAAYEAKQKGGAA